jgi:WD40 repeat protein
MRPLVFGTLLALLFVHSVHAQNENNRWVFGGAPFPTNPPSLDFNSGAPVGVPNVPVPSYYSAEAAASVAHSTTGTLLFYTDAQKVFTAGNVAMPNGGATFTTDLNGCNSSTQGALILPRPGMPGHYFIFTVDCTERFTSPTYSGLSYSEVDMSLNSGAGDIITGNRNLYLWGPPATNKLTEKLTAVRHPNGNDYWVVAHEWSTNNFLSFAVTCNGVNPVPVVSSVGTIHFSGSSFPNEVIGAMKISPDRTRLALVAQGVLNMIEIFNFDANTGIVSNPILLPGNGSQDYGLEFSPNSLRLYVTVYDPTPCCSGTLFQYNLAAGGAAAIQASKTQIATSATIGYGGMQLGPDNKIYISRVLQTNTLAVINSPNNLGAACGFSNTGPNLLTRRSNIGLINLVSFQTNPICPPLAVDFLYFEVIRHEREMELRWAVPADMGVAEFILERSSDGDEYLGYMTQAAADPIEGIEVHSIRHAYLSGPTYFRIKALGWNGEVFYSKVVLLRPYSSPDVTAHYDPASANIEVFLSEDGQIQLWYCSLMDLHGNTIFHSVLPPSLSQHIQIPLPHEIATGVYFLRLEDGHGLPIVTQKLLVAH